MQNVLLGGYVHEEIAKINANFNEVQTDYAKKTELPTVPTVPTNVSAFTNDADYQTETDVQLIVNTALINEVPTKLSDLENDANYVKSTDTVLVNKVDKVSGKDLSTNDYTTVDKQKVDRLGKIDFTTTNFGSVDSNGYYTATIEASGKYPVKVLRANGSNYEEVLAHTKVSGNNILIMSMTPFDGYVVTL